MGVEGRTALVTGTTRGIGRVIAKVLAEAALESLHACASHRDANLMGEVVAATEAGATMGEMAGVLRMAHGQPGTPRRSIT